MSTITATQQTAIARYLDGRHLGSGIGTAEEPCSIAAINLALSGRLTDDIPECMSPTIGRWIIAIQDAMPDDLRNSARWRSLLPLAAGTGRDHEAARAQALLDWMWTVVLPQLQPMADAQGFGAPWTVMCQVRTAKAARAAARAAGAARAAWAARAAAEARAAWAAEAEAREAAAWAAAWAARAAAAAAEARAAWAAEARAAWAAEARAAGAAEARAAGANYWTAISPCAMLDRLIRIGAES